MAAPDFYDRLIEPPQPGMTPDEQYRWFYDLWQRTGGYISYIPNLAGLVASVEELNTLVGILTNVTVQFQLDSKANSADLGTMSEQNADDVVITGGSLSSVDIVESNVSGDLAITIGTSTTAKTVGASLHGDVTAVSNSNGSENDLMTYTLLADMLGVNTNYIEIDAWGSFAANANNKRLKLYFGSTVIYDTGAIAANGGAWILHATVAREASADQKAIATIISGNALITAAAQITNPSEDSTTDIIVKTTATAVAANDVTQDGFTVKWYAGI